MADIRLSVGLQAASASSDAFLAEIKSLIGKMDWRSLPKVEVGVAVSKESLVSFRQELTDIMNSVTDGSGKKITLNFGGAVGTISSDLRDVERKYDNLKKKLSESIKVKIETGAIDAKIKSIEERANALRSKSEQLGSSMAIMASSAAVVKDDSKSPEERAAAYQRFAAAVNVATAAIKALEAAERSDDRAAKNLSTTKAQLESAIQSGEAAMAKMSASGLSGSEAFSTLSSAVEQAKAALESGTSDTEALKAAMDALKGATAGANSSLNGLNNPFAMLTNRLTYMFGPAGLVLLGIKQIKAMVKEATSIDTAMTQLRVVTNASEADYAAYGANITKTSKEIAASMTDLIDSTTVYARLGYSLEDSSNLAKYTAMLQNVGDIDAASATDAITAITKAYGVSASQIESVMNKLVIVGNNYPISVAQIAEGMNNAGSALSAAGNTFDQSVALLTAANTTVQDISKSSTGLRTIAARIRNTKVELDELGETVEEAKYEEVINMLTDNGVALTTLNGEYRSTYDILKDIADIWGDLTSMEQAAIAQQLAGTRQQNVFYSIVNQFREAEGAMQDMQNSTGALDAAYGKYMNSIEAHTDRFKASFQSLSKSVVNSDLVKDIVDIGTTIVGVLEKVLGAFNGIGAAVATSAIAGLLAPAAIGAIVKAWAGITAVLGPAAPVVAVIAAAIPMIVWGFSSLAKVIRESNPTLNDLNGELSQIQSNISAYNREINENESRIRSLESQSGGISKGEEAELERLKTRNVLLEEMVDLEAQLRDEKKAQAAYIATSDANSWLNGQRSGFYDVWDENAGSGAGPTNKWVDATGIGKLQDAVEQYKEVKSALENSDINAEDRRALINKMETAVNTITSEYEAIAPIINTLIEEGSPESIALASMLSEAFNEVKGVVGTTSGEYEAFKQSVSSMPRDAMEEFQNSTEITAETIAKMREESEAFDEWASGFAYGTGEEVNETLAVYISRMMSATDAASAADAADKARIQSLMTMNDELTATIAALERYKKALEGGEKGDALSAYGDAYKSFLEEYGAGRFGSVAYRQAIELFVPPEVLASLNYDMKAAGDMLANSYIKRIFTDGDNYAENFANLIDEVFGGDTGGIIDIFKNDDGSMDIAISSYEDLASALGISVEFATALADALSAYSNVVVTSDEETKKLADEIKELSGVDLGVNSMATNLEKFNAAVEAMAGKGFNASDIATALRQLEGLGYIDLSGIEGWGAMIQPIIDKVKELKDAAQEAGGEEPAPTIDADNKPAMGKISDTTDALLKLGEMVVEPTIKAAVKIGGMPKFDAGDFSVGGWAGKVVSGLFGNASGTKNAPAGLSLVNELGPELINDNGHVYIAGGGKPTVTRLHRGAIVLTAEETRDALEGGFTSAGKIRGYASGSTSTPSGSGPTRILDERLRKIQKMAQDAEVAAAAEAYAHAAKVAAAKARAEKSAAERKDKETGSLLKEIQNKLDLSGDGGKSGGGSKSGSGGKSGSGSKSGSDGDDWFSRQYAEHQHMLKMDQEDQQDYLDWLQDAYKKAYKQNLIDLKDYRKYEEEVYKLQQDIFNDYLSDQEHAIKLEEAGNNDPSIILNYYQNMIAAVEKEIKAANKRGLDNNNAYVQSLQNKWISYTNAIRDLNKDADNEAREAVKDLVDYRVKMLKQYIKDEQKALKDRLSYLKDFYSRQKDLLQDTYDEEKYLENQAEKRRSVTEIQAQIEQLRYDNSAAAQKKLLKLQDDLAKSQKELADFEKDHALDTAKDELDKLYELQETEINNRLDELDRRLNDPKALYEQALSDVQNNSIALYQEMVEYNNRVGTGIETDIIDKWEEAYVSLKKYHDLYNEYYKGINLVNATGWYPGKDNPWSRTVPAGGYASGTSNAKPGLRRVDENGAEWLFTAKDGEHYRLFSGGEKVINARATDFLYDFATNGGQVISNLISRAGSLFSMPSPATVSGPNIQMGDIIINGSADQRTVSEIRRAQREATTMLLKEFCRLNKQS